MADKTEPLLQECATCGTLIDVTQEEPFALMHCPTCGAAMRVRRQFGNFELQEILGAGGMGAVYRALDTTLGRSVALKLLRKEYTSDPEFVRQFEYEASITALINHPNVVKVYSTASDHGLFYIAMELVDKGSLDDLMTLQGSVAEPQVLEVGIQIAQGLNAALIRGLIHRDVKPGNILFADAHHAKIVDFGLARLMDQNGDVSGEIWGTPYYVAPEKLDTPPKEDLRSDIYSLGATLFHAIAGRPPYEAEDASMVALKHLKSQPVSLQAFAPNVSNATAYVINRTLNKDPEQRYASYEELIEHLEYARSELLVAGGGARQSRRMVLEDERSQRMMSWVTAGILAAMLLGGVGLYVFRDKVFAAGKTATVAASKPGGAQGLIDRRYKEAQRLLAEGKTSEAADSFAKLEEEADLQQPLRNWITLHAGLSRLCDSHPEEARTEFQKLVDAGPYTFDPTEEKLANFFPAVARLLIDEAPTPASISKDYSKTNFEAIALLIFAAKDWEAGDFDDAGPLFRQFHSSSPDSPYDWIVKYRDLANRYIGRYSAYREISERIKAARTPAQQESTLTILKDSLQRPELKGKIGEKAAAVVQEFESQVTKRHEEQAQKLAEKEAVDSKAIADAKARMNSLCVDYKFKEANTVVAAIKVSTDKGKLEKDTLTKRTRWLAEFKGMLVDDLTALGFAGAVVKKAGGSIPGGVARASDAQMEVKTPYGVFPIAWSEVSYAWTYDVGKSFIRTGLPPDALAHREWCLGVYAFFIGKAHEGRALVEAAAKAKPEYQEELKIFPEAGASETVSSNP